MTGVNDVNDEHVRTVVEAYEARSPRTGLARTERGSLPEMCFRAVERARNETVENRNSFVCR